MRVLTNGEKNTWYEVVEKFSATGWFDMESPLIFTGHWIHFIIFTITGFSTLQHNAVECGNK